MGGEKNRRGREGRATLLTTRLPSLLPSHSSSLQDAGGGPGAPFHLLEVVLDKTTGIFAATVKSERGPPAAQAAGAAFAAAMRPLLPA